MTSVANCTNNQNHPESFLQHGQTRRRKDKEESGAFGVISSTRRRALSDWAPSSSTTASRAAQRLHGGKLALCPTQGVETRGELPCDELQKPVLGVRVEAVMYPR
ncbi:hypothetical protein [Streptomyces sp900105755]|uniref:Uncharacterized protein n=1 Tax=Streptomyces sp. 900105755 TaxID=3154389 RepID=A0ABV1TH42_9ACTN